MTPRRCRPCCVGSNANTYVTAVLLQQVDKGGLKLDDTTHKFDICVTVPNAGHITIRKLCQVRGGEAEKPHSAYRVVYRC